MSKVRQIIEAYVAHNYPRRIQKRFATWIMDRHHKEEKEEILLDLWSKLDVAADSSTENAFRLLQSRITKCIRPQVSFFSRMLRVAVILFLPLISMVATYIYMKNDIRSVNNDIQLVEYFVPNGTTRVVTLPDSSKVRLNAGSLMIIPERFGSTRNVFLNGEAYFEVTHDEKHPFIVKTTDMSVEVLGTVFNLKAYAEEESSSTVLLSGKVNVRFTDNATQSMLLKPNEQVRYNRKTKVAEKQSANVEQSIAWIHNNLVIQRMSIDEIAKVIERKYNLKVYINSQRFRNEKISMKFMNNENITEFMSVLKYLVPGLQYKLQGDKLYIY